jgi:general secretion pathway protein N
MVLKAIYKFYIEKSVDLASFIPIVRTMQRRRRSAMDTIAPTWMERRAAPGMRIGVAALWGALAGLFVGAVVYLPAAWVAQGAESTSQGRLRMPMPMGTLWSGSSMLELSDGREAARALPSRIQWSAAPVWLGVDVKMWADCCAKQPMTAAVRLGARGLTASFGGGSLLVPASWFAGLGSPWSSLRPEGWVGVSLSGARMERVDGSYQLLGQAALDISGFCSALSAACPLGSYKLAYQASQGGRPSITATTVGPAALSITGAGELGAQGWSFQGRAQADAQKAQSVAALLPLFGRREGDASIIEYPVRRP